MPYIQGTIFSMCFLPTMYSPDQGKQGGVKKKGTMNVDLSFKIVFRGMSILPRSESHSPEQVAKESSKINVFCYCGKGELQIRK